MEVYNSTKYIIGLVVLGHFHVETVHYTFLYCIKALMTEGERKKELKL